MAGQKILGTAFEEMEDLNLVIKIQHKLKWKKNEFTGARGSNEKVNTVFNALFRSDRQSTSHAQTVPFANDDDDDEDIDGDVG